MKHYTVCCLVNMKSFQYCCTVWLVPFSFVLNSASTSAHYNSKTYILHPNCLSKILSVLLIKFAMDNINNKVINHKTVYAHMHTQEVMLLTTFHLILIMWLLGGHNYMMKSKPLSFSESITSYLHFMVVLLKMPDLFISKWLKLFNISSKSYSITQWDHYSFTDNTPPINTCISHTCSFYVFLTPVLFKVYLYKCYLKVHYMIFPFTTSTLLYLICHTVIHLIYIW